MKRLKRIVAGALITGMLVFLTACNSGVKLFINVEKGDSYNYHLVSKTTIMDSEYKFKSIHEMATDFGIKVEGKDKKGNMNLKYTYDALRIDSDANGAKTSFDSLKQAKDDPLSKVLATTYKSIIGKGFSCKMNKFGEVQNISGVDEVINSMLDVILPKDNPKVASMDASMKEQIKGNIDKSFGEEAIKLSIQQSTRMYPKDMVKVGDIWETSYDVKYMEIASVKVKHILNKLEGEIAYITMTADMPLGSGELNKMMGTDFKGDFEGKITGNLKINKNNGFLCNGTMKIEMNGSLRDTDPSTQKENGTPMSFISETTFSTTKK